MTEIKFNFKNLPEFNKSLEKQVRKAIKNERVLKEVGDAALTHVKGRMKLGKLPDENTSHKKPNKAWIKKRADLIADGKVTAGDTYKKNKALVFTGQLADSLVFKIRRGKPKISILAKGNHKPYEKGGKQISNKKLLEYIREKREVFGFTEAKRKEITNLVARGLRRLLK